jgi:tetratricopeptide (TPR) repeat protein
LKLSPQDSEAFILQGQIQVLQNHFDDGIATFRQALKFAPDNAMGHYQLGVAFQKKGDTGQAESEWHTAVRLRPNLAEAWFALGASAVQRSDWKALEPIGTQLEKIAPNSPHGYLFHATAKFNQGDAVTAEADLMHLLDAFPGSALGYVRLGQLRAEQKRWDEAENAYRQALLREPNSIEALHGWVELDFRRNRPSDAIRLVQSQIDRIGDQSAIYSLLGQAQLRNRQPAEAARALARAIELDNQNVNALISMADAQRALGNIDQAILTYKQAIELVPNDIRLYLAEGSLYELQGNWQQAQSMYQKALSIQPDHALAANNFAYLLLEHGGNVNVALTLAQTARRGMPGLPNSADTLGWAYYHNGAFSVAAPLLEEAVKKVPENSTYHYHLGLTYQKLNESRQARAALEKAIRIDPKSPIAAQARRALELASGT